MLERQEALCSKKPEGVRQEIWGILLAYNLVRKQMMQLPILPERRSERRYKRHVKIKMSGYKRNSGRPTPKTAESKGKVLI